ncbi:hypothetical protein SynROS8604_02497 [Synechococcus sp. ROS8604]|nr:hypothetical protein SynROS8604_02497 [Synechococcus sp. ROS8604]
MEARQRIAKVSRKGLSIEIHHLDLLQNASSSLLPMPLRMG